MRVIGIFTAASTTLLVWLLPAFAGDTAAVNVLGFSPDGGVFAFEEYGAQDGSGFPYANRFYIDTATDEFLTGTPVRVTLDDETATVEAARADAKARGEKLFKDTVLDMNRGDLIAFNAVTEYSADPFRLAANPRPIFAPVDPVFEVRLEEFNMQLPEQCKGFDEIMGFRLIRVASTPNDQTVLLHEDSSLPKSRGCPNGYRLGGIQTFYPRSGDPVFAILVAIRSYGFEGPDYRWIAVAGKF
jgi:predicted secreted protein